MKKNFVTADQYLPGSSLCELRVRPKNFHCVEPVRQGTVQDIFRTVRIQAILLRAEGEIRWIHAVLPTEEGSGVDLRRCKKHRPESNTHG
jgi:hypothetical protein